jgi:integrase
MGCEDLPAYHGPARRLPVMRVRWLEDRPRGDCAQRAPRILERGYRRGIKPGNWNRKFPPEPLTPSEVLRLLDVIPGGKVGVRNKALIALMWRTGLRVECEALQLMPHHLDFQAKRVTVLRGKNGKRRIVALDAFAINQLSPWLWERARLGIPDTAHLFCSVSLPNPGRPMWSAYVREAMHDYGRKAGIPKRVHPHGLRHAMACDLIRDGFPLSHAQAQLGHSSIATTAIYLRGLGMDEAFEAIANRPMRGGSTGAPLKARWSWSTRRRGT